MPRTLQPGDQISRYRIVGPLGAGGMGEVYRARDQSLDRDVALKILPLELVRSEERVRRFVLEAKSASSLNHPNIVTIYEIGEQPLTSSDPAGDGRSGGVHFISMEMVAGETLGHKIHEERTDLKTLLGWLAQAADGIAKAHAAGIVHRDLKPGNIMVSSDGYAKVLDFGLAKLTERTSTDALQTSAPTELADRTADGVVLGTAAYMSPEQVVGKPVDHRTDIFSFGCILYEAATRRRPFSAESTVETMHKILNEKPAPIEELNPNVPAELRRLIRRCLAKNPDQRLQSMKDLSIELREMVEEYDALSASAGSASGSGTIAALPVPPRRFPLVPVVAAVLIGLVGLAIGLWGLRRGGGSERAPVVKMTTLTNRGDVADAVLSPDGRYLAYVSGGSGQERLWVRQIATGSDIQILAPQNLPPTALTFSPDGNYVYYLSLDPERSGYRALFQVPSLGGAPVKKGYDIDAPVAFAPDGRSFCFMRGYPAEKSTKLVISDLESGKERILADIKSPQALTQARPAWSPDGRTIAALVDNAQDGFKARLALFRVSDGQEQKFESPVWPQVNSMVWAPDGKSFVIAGLENATNARTQVMTVSYPGGRLRPITTGFESYASVSITQDGRTLAALRNSLISNLWTIDFSGPAPAAPRQLTFASNSDNSANNPQPAPDNATIVYQSPSNQRLGLWTIGMDGTGQKQLTSGKGVDFDAFPVPGGAIYHHIDEDLRAHVWRVDNDGGNAKALTEGAGERIEDVSLDGKWVLLTRADKPGTLYIMPGSGGEQRPLVTDFQNNGLFSPDAQYVKYTTVREIEGVVQFTPAVVRTADGQPVSFRRIPPRSLVSIWSSDGPSILWINRADPGWNVFRQKLDDTPSEQVTHFADGRVLALACSPDGRRLAVARQAGPVQNAWIIDMTGGSEPLQVTSFQNGIMYNAQWSYDSRTLVMAYGSANRDAVLIRDFQ